MLDINDIGAFDDDLNAVLRIRVFYAALEPPRWPFQT